MVCICFIYYIETDKQTYKQTELSKQTKRGLFFKHKTYLKSGMYILISKSGMTNLSEFRYAHLISCLKSGTYRLIWSRLCRTSLTSCVTLLHWIYPYLWHKYFICDRRNELVKLFHTTIRLAFWHLRWIKCIRIHIDISFWVSFFKFNYQNHWVS